MRLIKRMGSLGGLIKLIPGMNKIDDGMMMEINLRNRIHDLVNDS